MLNMLFCRLWASFLPWSSPLPLTSSMFKSLLFVYELFRLAVDALWFWKQISRVVIQLVLRMLWKTYQRLVLVCLTWLQLALVSYTLLWLALNYVLLNLFELTLVISVVLFRSIDIVVLYLLLVKVKGKGRTLDIAPQVDIATTKPFRFMVRTKQRRTYLPYTFPAVAGTHLPTPRGWRVE